MARPRKEPSAKMDDVLRIPMTAEQKRLIIEASKANPLGMAAWARDILLKAAEVANK